MKLITDRILWKIYLVLMVLVTFASINTISTRIWDIIGLIVALPEYIAMYGFCFRTAIFKKEVWKAYFIVYVLWNFMHIFLIGMGSKLPDGTIQIVNINNYYAIIFTIVVLIPLLLILYKYGYREDEIWKLPNNR